MIKTFKEKHFYHSVVIWLLIVCWYFIFVYSFFNIFRLKTQDFFTSQSFYIFSQPPKESDEIVIVAIDELSRQRLNLKWPWKRNVTAKLVNKIASFAPKVIGLDIVFSGESDEDKELISAFNNHPHIVLGYILRKDKKDLPLQAFVDAVDGVGFVNRPYDESNILRNTRFFHINKQGEVNFSIDTEVLIAYLDAKSKGVRFHNKGIFLGEKMFIPSKQGITPINYLVHPNDFAIVPAFLVLEDKASPHIFNNKIVLIGATDPLIHDEHPTPLGVFPGVSVIGNSLVMVLSERFIHDFSSRIFTFLIIFVLGILILFMTNKFRFNFYSLFSFLIILSIIFVSCVYMRSKDIVFDYFSILFLCGSSYIIPNVYKYVYLIYMRNKLKDLAIKDSLTGLYTRRYFLLKVDEELKDSSASMSFFGFLISNYQRLIIDLSDEELKILIKSISEYVEAGLKKIFKDVILSHLSQDMIGALVRIKNKSDAENCFKTLLDGLNKAELKIKDKKVKFSLKGILLYKPKGKKMSSGNLIYNLEFSLNCLKEKPEDKFFMADLKDEMWGSRPEPAIEDILDFLAIDLQGRDKDLEKTLTQLIDSKKEAEKAYFGVILSLVKALEQKDTFTQGHSERVARYVKDMALELGLSGEEGESIRKAALLHDIGKIGLSDYLLHKKDRLSDDEFTLIKKHALISVEILKPIKAFSELLPIILHHHESFDGTGYPYGLSGDMIPRGAQILAVADSFDAITSGRGYKKGKNAREAIEELEKCKGAQFNPIYVDALRRVIKI